MEVVRQDDAFVRTVLERVLQLLYLTQKTLRETLKVTSHPVGMATWRL